MSVLAVVQYTTLIISDNKVIFAIHLLGDPVAGSGTGSRPTVRRIDGGDPGRGVARTSPRKSHPLPQHSAHFVPRIASQSIDRTLRCPRSHPLHRRIRSPPLAR